MSDLLAILVVLGLVLVVGVVPFLAGFFGAMWIFKRDKSEWWFVGIYIFGLAWPIGVLWVVGIIG